MNRSAGTIVVASAIYGFAIASVHSVRLAVWNLAKFPLLILVTAAVCAPAYFAASLVVTRRLGFRDVLRLSLGTFADLSMLLASLAPVSYLLARTVVQPTGGDLGEYPFFLGLNVAFIAACGSLALVRRALRLARGDGIGLRRSVTFISAWLAISLFVGGQCAWYMRPFFGPRTVPDPPFMEGTAPGLRGETSFYEAVWLLVDPPPPGTCAR